MKKILATILLVFSSAAYAQKASSGFSYSMPAVEVGFKWNTTKVNNSTSDKQVMGYQLGISTVANMSDSFGVRTGLFYTERPFESDFAASNSKGKFTYFEVPLQLMFKIEDYAGVYVGPSLAVKLSDEVSPGSLTDVKSMVIPLTFGAAFKFLPNFGINAFFETVSGDLANNVSNSRAVGVNLLITLD
ncbi:porin family protein [bacterium]|nr:porin family protein [bacterium]